jgi:hypothetical protein
LGDSENVDKCEARNAWEAAVIATHSNLSPSWNVSMSAPTSPIIERNLIQENDVVRCPLKGSKLSYVSQYVLHANVRSSSLNDLSGISILNRIKHIIPGKELDDATYLPLQASESNNLPYRLARYTTTKAVLECELGFVEIRKGKTSEVLNDPMPFLR